MACSADAIGGASWRTDGGERDAGEDAGEEEDGGTTEVDANRPDANVSCEVPGSCNPFEDRACSGSRSCRPNATLDGMECNELEDDPLGEGELCTTGASCSAGTVCAGTDIANYRCRRLCPTGSIGYCPEGEWCSESTGVTCFDVCAPAYEECDIYTPGCASEEVCAPILHPETALPITACVSAGEGADGAACGDGVGGGCGPGLICVRVDGAEICRQVCRPDGSPACPSGQVCSGTIPSWEITHCLSE